MKLSNNEITLWSIIIKSLPHKKSLIALGIISRIPMLVSPVLFGYFITLLTRNSSGNTAYTLISYIFGLGLLSIVFTFINERISIISFSEQEVNLKKIVWGKIYVLPDLVRDSYTNGVWMQKFTRDIAVISGLCKIIIDSGLGFMTFFLGTFIVFASKTPSISIIFLLSLMLTTIIYLLFKHKIEDTSRNLRETLYNEGSTILDLIEMLPILNIFGIVHLYSPFFGRSVDVASKQQIKQKKIVTNFKMAIKLEFTIINMTVLLLCTFFFLDKKLVVGDIVMYNILISETLGGLSQIFNVIPELGRGIEYKKSLQQIFDLGDVNDKNNYGNYNDNQYAYDISNISFDYDNKNSVLNNFSTKIKKNEFVCFLGRNGTGKSTLAKIMSGSYKPKSGIIISSESNPAIVPQRIVVYNDTLLENIRLKDTSITEETVRDYLQKCGFNQFLQKHSNNLHTKIKTNMLSGGELQLLGIVRALVHNRNTLILDEITNNLDIVAKEAIYSVLEYLSGKCTIILITHDISCLRIADRIFVFQKNLVSEAKGTSSDDKISNAINMIMDKSTL